VWSNAEQPPAIPWSFARGLRIIMIRYAGLRVNGVYRAGFGSAEDGEAVGW
jgi:hypothetical protein